MSLAGPAQAQDPIPPQDAESVEAEPADIAPAADAAPQAPPAPPKFDESALRRAKVIRTPTDAEIRPLYPMAAREKALGGHAEIICEITLAQRLEKCVVDKEDPPGFGFGEAVIQVAGFYRVAPPTYQGEPIPGAKMRIPMTFELELPSIEQQEADRAADAAAKGEAPPNESPADRLKRLGPLKRSPGVLWAPQGFAIIVAAGALWALFWPNANRSRTRRRSRRAADQWT